MKTLALMALLLSAPAPWNATLDFEATERALATARVTRIRSLKAFLTHDEKLSWEGTSEHLLLDLEGGRKAVFRSEDEPWGSVAEVAGYRFARRLGSRLVPPTVSRTLEPVPGQPWPFPGKAVRPGSVQLFVSGKPTGDELPASLTPKDASDIDVISYVSGRYDNHGGNLLLDPSGAPVLIDFENSLEPQQWRWGEFSYARRGGEHASPDMLSDSQPFPFDRPRTLADPSLATIQKTFGPWWNQSWPEGMKGLHEHIQRHPKKTVSYALWGDRLWVQCWAGSRHPPAAQAFSRATLDALARLDAATLKREILSEEYRPLAVRLMLERRDRVLAEARGKPLIP